jgi:HTH-type transcriptional regulator/antitoxin HigA
MTTGLKTPNDYYLQLLMTFPPRPINTEEELAATQARIDSLIDQKQLTQDDQDYLNLLGMLVYDYEKKHEPEPVLGGVELLKTAMEEASLQPQDLAPILGDESAVNRILNGTLELNVGQLNQLAELFHVSPARLLT